MPVLRPGRLQSWADALEENNMTTLQICALALLVLAALTYLAACAGAKRWLSLRAWIGRTSCSHKHRKLITIEFDGEAVYVCESCEKAIRVPL